MTRGTLMEEDSLTTGWLTGAPRSLSCRTSPLFPLSLGRRKASEVQHLASRPSMARNFRSLVGWLGLVLSPGKPPSDQIWPCLVFPCWPAGWLERLWLWLAGWRLWLAGSHFLLDPRNQKNQSRSCRPRGPGQTFSPQLWFFWFFWFFHCVLQLFANRDVWFLWFFGLFGCGSCKRQQRITTNAKPSQ